MISKIAPQCAVQALCLQKRITPLVRARKKKRKKMIIWREMPRTT